MSSRQMWVHVKILRAVVVAVPFVLASCQAAELPTRMPVATIDVGAQAQTASEAVVNMPPTWTPLPTFVEETATPLPTKPPPATSTPIPTAVPPSPTSTPSPSPLPTATLLPTNTAMPPTSTPVPPPTNTPLPLEPSATPPPPTDTPMPPPPVSPTDTPMPPPPPEPTTPPQPEFGPNLLPNPSFEEGHYNSGGVGELQVPNGWTFEWSGGTNPFVSPPDDYFVRPETRVLPAYQLPPHEQPLFIWDGQFTMKIFKGYWAIDVQLVTDLYLEPGTYLFEINVFPDLVVSYDNGQKVYAPDPFSGEVRFVVSGAGTGWFPPVFGQRNGFNHTFGVSQAQTIRVGVGLRNRYGIMNNGWFVDHWSLRRVNNP